METPYPQPGIETRDDLEEIQAIMRIIQARLEPVELIKLDEREIISYRLAEIFSQAKGLYTGLLPRFIEMKEIDQDTVFEAFGEVRMGLLHIKDLIEEFEEAFLLSLGETLAEESPADPSNN